MSTGTPGPVLSPAGSTYNTKEEGGPRVGVLGIGVSLGWGSPDQGLWAEV